MDTQKSTRPSDRPEPEAGTERPFTGLAGGTGVPLPEELNIALDAAHKALQEATEPAAKEQILIKIAELETRLVIACDAQKKRPGSASV